MFYSEGLKHKRIGENVKNTTGVFLVVTNVTLDRSSSLGCNLLIGKRGDMLKNL